jgi:segregation and condensation protein A
MVETALTRLPDEEHHPVIRPHKITVRDKIALIRERLAADGRVSFRALIETCATRMEVIVSFMAVLELIKSHVLDAMQDAAFADIVLVPADADVAGESPPRDASSEAETTAPGT